MKFFYLSFAFVLLLGLSACSNDPEDPPKFRVRNDRTTNASLQVQTSGGNTININNVVPGSTSAYQEVAQGRIDVTVQIQGDNNHYTGSFYAVNNQTFTIVVANTEPPAVSVVSP